MKMEFELPDQSPGRGLQLRWEEGHEITVQTEGGTTIIRANKAGLISLARHLLTMAYADPPPGYHIHFDESNSLEPGSSELIVEQA